MVKSTNTASTIYHSPFTIYQLQSFFPEELDEVADAAGVAPLVVVPGEHLDEIAVDDFRVVGVHDGGVVVLAEVHRDERLLREGENAAQLLVRRVLQRRIDLLARRL